MIYLGNGLYSDSGPSLSHHGIKGQEWGVRRGPPYPIDDKVLRKGYRLQSMTPNKDSEAYRLGGKWLYTSNNKYDNHIYNGSFARGRILRDKPLQALTGTGSVYSHKFEVTQDLKMPTKKERYDHFTKLMKSKPGEYSKELAAFAKKRYQFRKGATPEAKRLCKYLASGGVIEEKDYPAAFEIFNSMVGTARDNYEISTKWANHMEKNYDAMVDDNDVKLYNGAKDPIIIFKPEKMLKVSGKPTEVTARNRLNNSIAESVQKLGNIYEQKKNPNMYHSDELKQYPYLEHYGVLGMRWGVRKAAREAINREKEISKAGQRYLKRRRDAGYIGRLEYLRARRNTINSFRKAKNNIKLEKQKSLSSKKYNTDFAKESERRYKAAFGKNIAKRVEDSDKKVKLWKNVKLGAAAAKLASKGMYYGAYKTDSSALAKAGIGLNLAGLGAGLVGLKKGKDAKKERNAVYDENYVSDWYKKYIPKKKKGGK